MQEVQCWTHRRPKIVYTNWRKFNGIGAWLGVLVYKVSDFSFVRSILVDPLAVIEEMAIMYWVDYIAGMLAAVFPVVQVYLVA